MNDGISSILSQIRAFETQARSGSRIVNPSIGPGAPRESGFVDTLQSTLREVNASQLGANEMAARFELGDPRVDLARVMIASQQAQLGFRAVVEVRNRLVQAYQDVMNMPI